MIVIRTGSSLTLINTLRLDRADLDLLDSIGNVENIMRLGSYNGRDDAFYKCTRDATA